MMKRFDIKGTIKGITNGCLGASTFTGMLFLLLIGLANSRGVPFYFRTGEAADSIIESGQTAGIILLGIALATFFALIIQTLSSWKSLTKGAKKKSETLDYWK